MKLIKPSFEIIEQDNTLLGAKKHIEKAARTCYKSENLITDDSAEKMFNRLVDSKHLAMLEHSTIYLAMPISTAIPYELNEWYKYELNPYTKGGKVCKVNGQRRVAYTTNLRVLRENGWLDDLVFMCEPTEYHEKRVTVKFVTDQGVLREFTRHRVFSFAVESTRYCNYSKDKFGNQLTFILPPWADEELIKSYGEHHTKARSRTPESIFIACLNNAEKDYLELLEMGWKPEQARNVLPLATKCEIVMTGFVSDWEHFFELRAKGTTGKPHPQAEELALPLMEEFINRGML
jgi:thymidylate synthase (FAD)